VTLLERLNDEQIEGFQLDRLSRNPCLRQAGFGHKRRSLRMKAQSLMSKRVSGLC